MLYFNYLRGLIFVLVLVLCTAGGPIAATRSGQCVSRATDGREPSDGHCSKPSHADRIK